MLDPDVLIFGGAFDPPHNGHVTLVEAAGRVFPNARLLLVPTYSPPPVAGLALKRTGASFEQRVAMTRFAFAPLMDRAEVSEIESRLPTPSYSLQTVMALTRESPGKRFGLLLGEDQFLQFFRWHNAKSLIKLCLLVVGSREGLCLDLARVKLALAPLELTITDCLPTQPGRFLIPEVESGMVAVQTANHPAASQVIRNRIAEGLNVASGWLNPEVERYILHHNLYSQTGFQS